MVNELHAHKLCKDDISKIENYEKAKADASHTWILHHRLELTIDGANAHTAKELQRLDMYYDRPYFELIFLNRSEHTSLHMKGENNHGFGKTGTMKGKHQSADTRKKMSASRKEYWKRCKQEEISCADLI